jgi:hypothetical protein
MNETQKFIEDFIKESQETIAEKDLEVLDVWESPNGNLFIKVSEEYSIGIGPKGHHAPNIEWGELNRSQYVKASNVCPVKKVGKLVFD